MTDLLTKKPAKSILRKSSTTFEHKDEIDLLAEKVQKVVVRPQDPPELDKEEVTDDVKVKRQEFDHKRKLHIHEEGAKVQLARKLLSQEEDDEEDEHPKLVVEEESEEDG